MTAEDLIQNIKRESIERLDLNRKHLNTLICGDGKRENLSHICGYLNGEYRIMVELVEKIRQWEEETNEQHD